MIQLLGPTKAHYCLGGGPGFWLGVGEVLTGRPLRPAVSKRGLGGKDPGGIPFSRLGSFAQSFERAQRRPVSTAGRVAVTPPPPRMRASLSPSSRLQHCEGLSRRHVTSRTNPVTDFSCPRLLEPSASHSCFLLKCHCASAGVGIGAGPGGRVLGRALCRGVTVSDAVLSHRSCVGEVVCCPSGRCGVRGLVR